MNYLKPPVSLKPKVLEVWNQIKLPLLKHYPVPFGSRLSGNKFLQISNSIIWTKTKVKKSQQTGFCQSAFVLLLLSCIVMCRWPPGNNVAIVWWKSCETAFQFKKKLFFSEPEECILSMYSKDTCIWPEPSSQDDHYMWLQSSLSLVIFLCWTQITQKEQHFSTCIMAWHMDDSHLHPGGGGGYSLENWVGVCGPLPKTLTLFMTKICDFSYPIYDLTKNLIPYL